MATAGLAAGLATSAPALGDEAPPVAVAARLADDGETAKLVFDLSGPVPPMRARWSIPTASSSTCAEVSFQIDPSVGRPRDRAQAIVKGFRFGLFGPGKSRVVIDLAEPACVAKVETAPIAKGAAPSRLGDRAQALRARRLRRRGGARRAGGRRSRPGGGRDAAAPAADRPVIVLDPGHGGVDGGAYGVGGAVEKTLVYDYALELQRQLEAKGRFKVVLTRHGDEFVSLDDRVRLARERGRVAADLDPRRHARRRGR